MNLEELEVGLAWRISVPPDPGQECPPADGTQPPRYHRFHPAAHPTARSWTCPHPSARYAGAASTPFFRRWGHREDPAAADSGTRTDDGMQPPTRQHTSGLASLGSGWPRSESNAPGASSYARTRTSTQAQWATTCRRPWPTRKGTHPGLQGPAGRPAHSRTASSRDQHDETVRT
ncbi:hypothetical protein PIB30_083512 [Stylosanthes scabra]|uniref:Uncharacterized protein n=1 Tax=Stylosanthes scabra TaxID=79078 RepID=A0ABU6VRG1_9FABA|nr:hypothetical protein [Stylosanthes scabra]